MKTYALIFYKKTVLQMPPHESGWLMSSASSMSTYVKIPRSLMKTYALMFYKKLFSRCHCLRLFIIPIFIVLCLAGTSCRQEGQYRIGVSQCSADDWRSKMNDEIMREMMFHPEATVEIRSADDSNEKQIADIRYFRDNGFDVILAAPNEANAITPIIKETYESGTPVVVFDRDINGDSYTAYIGVDNRAIGRSAAQYARNLVGPGAKILEIQGLKGSSPAIHRHEGFAEGAKIGNLDVVATAYGDWNDRDAARVTDSLLNIHKDIDLIYAHNDRMAIAASNVARRRGLHVKTIGIDAAPGIGMKAVSDSVIDATFLYPTEGHELVRTALAIVKGEPFERVKTLPLASAVDKSNADILLLQNKSLNEETSKMKILKGQVDEYWEKHSMQTTLLYATIGLIVLLLAFVFLLLRTFWMNKRHQQQMMEQNRLLEQQRDAQERLNRQLEEATQSKLMFFTNISHDLRTPLTLIAEPIAQLAKAGNLTEQQHALIRMADKNVRILKRLINEILDFRKYENGKLDVRLTEARFGELALDWAESFRAVAQRRDIKLTVDIDLAEDFTLAVDVEKMERVCFNLLSNAFKYTPDNGRINFSVRADGGNMTISVRDTGRGISERDLGNIFDRFFQVDKVHPQGSGIGLSLVKAFVELHHGTISVSSQEGKGSEFTVTIPVTHVDKAEYTTAVHPDDTMRADTMTELEHIEASRPDTDTDKPMLLVIDDNEDIRKLVTTLLGDEYAVISAPDGKEGVRMAAKYVPDLIICDVMMPVMDGLECTRRIKEEVTTSHIPVLMLTACSMDEQRAQGYDSGADAYLSKPFDITVLKSRCRNLIQNRRRIKELWSGSSTVPSTPRQDDKDSTRKPVPDIENEFYARFVEIVNRDMGNSEMSVDSIAADLGLGRSQFYRKIKALTNYSPVELVRELRLKRSRELLISTSRSVSEIAYEVGFSTPAYFTRCFRDCFNETPSELRERLAAK